MNRSTFLRLYGFSLLQVLVGNAAIAQLPTIDQQEAIIFNHPNIGRPTDPTGDPTGRPGVSSCKQGNKPLTALVPAYPVPSQEGSPKKVTWGVTINAQPTLWFYVPYDSTAATGKFVLENTDQQQTIHQIPLAAKPGILEVSLADLNVSLEEGQLYRWYFLVYCQNSEEADSDVSGSMTRQRISPSLFEQVTQTNDLQRKVRFFAQNGIWHEALSISGALHCARPQNSSWVQLLQGTGFQDFIQEPIVGCPTPEK